MSCKDVEKDLVAYAEGDLDDLRSEVVRAHLEACARCRSEAQAVRRTLRLAAAYRVPPLSEGAGVRMLAGVRERVDRRRRRVRRLAPALVVVAAVLALTVVGLRLRTPDVAPLTEKGGEGGPVGADRIALLSNDPELFDEVMERLSGLDVGGVQGAQKGGLRASTGQAGVERPREAEPLWREYQKGYFPGVGVESLLKDLSDEEMDQVLEKIEERLTV